MLRSLPGLTSSATILTRPCYLFLPLSIARTCAKNYELDSSVISLKTAGMVEL